MNKRILVLKQSSIKLKIYSEYMIVTYAMSSDVVAFRYLNELYINKNIQITPAHLIRLASFFSVYFIDHLGNVLASVRLEK